MGWTDMLLTIALSFGASVFPARTALRFLPERPERLRRFAPYVLFAVTLSTPIWFGDGNPLYLFPFFLLVFGRCYQGSLPARLVTGTVFFEWMIAWSMLVDTRTVLPYTFVRIGTFVWKLTAWAVVWLLARRLLPEERPPQLSERLWALLGVLALSTLFAELGFSFWHIDFYTDSTVSAVIDAAAYTMLPFCLASALALLLAIIVLSRHEALEREHQLDSMRALYYDGLRREHEQVRRLRHDMANHLTALSGLLSQDGGDGRVLEYLRGLQAAAGGAAGRFTDNDTVNIVLSAKAAAMKQAGLTADFNVVLPETLPVSDPDLCALFGNAIDNAMEAAWAAADKRITVRARAEKGLLMIRVINAYAGERRTDRAGRFRTTKEDSRAHGLGLRGMRETAQRYGGTLEAAAVNGVFELIVCMPLREKEM